MPTVVLQPGSAGIDTYLWWLLANNNHGANEYILTGRNLDYRRGLIRFDLSSIPAGSIITSAQLELTLTGSAAEGPQNVSVRVHRSLVDWFEGSQVNAVPPGGQNASTWNHRNANGSVGWNGGPGGGAGSDFAASATATVTVSKVSNSTWQWNVTADVLDWVYRSQTNRGWWIIGEEAVEATMREFASSDRPTAAQRPKLTVVYTEVTFVNRSGTANGTSSVTGTVTLSLLSGSAAGTAAVTGAITLSLLEGSAAGTSTVVGEITNSLLEGSAEGQAEVVGNLVDNVLAGLAEGVGIASGSVLPVTDGTVPLCTTSIICLNLPFGRPAPSMDGTVQDTDKRHMLLLYCESLHVPTFRVVNNTPLLYITDGTVKPNGQLNKLDLISRSSGICITNWRPAAAQYKDGGYYNDSALATGRRLVMRRFQNMFEVFEFTLKAPGEDEAIELLLQLNGWLEQAADYWESSWGTRPVYLVHKTARELNPRYGIIQSGSVPDFPDPHASPFFTGTREKVVIDNIMLRIEHNLWTDFPPGESLAVPISSFRSWTVAGWEAIEE